MTESTIKKPLRQRRRECVSEMKKIMALIGYWNIRKSHLAEKHQVGWRSVDKWLTDLLIHFPAERVMNIRVMGESTFRSNLAACERIIADPNTRTKDKLDAVGRMNETLRLYTQFLEAYGMKEKIAEEVKLSGGLDMERLLQVALEDKNDHGDVKEITEEKNENKNKRTETA